MHRIAKDNKINAIWIALGLIALLIRQIFARQPELTEQLYSRGVFLGVRVFIDYLLAWIPFPLLYLFVPAVIYLIGRQLSGWYHKSFASTTGRVVNLLGRTGAFLGGSLFFFFMLWGYNYNRVLLEQQLGLELEPLSVSELRKELYEEGAELKRLRRLIPQADTYTIEEQMLPEDLEGELRNQLESWLESHGYPTIGSVRGKLIYPKGIFLRFSSSGLYFPFTGEGHIDAALHPLQRISVMAHELGHGYGFGHEGTCNFLAYIACSTSDDPLIAYAGRLSYWRTLAVNYRRYEPEAYREYRESLPLGIQADLDAINELLLRYPDIMPEFRYHAYDAYLKAQGIEEGIKNYSRVIMLVRAWKESQRI